VLTVASARPEDATAIADLMEEMDRFYGVTEFESVEERVEQITAMLFREHPAAYLLLARDGGRSVGFASYSFLWPAVGLTQSLYLKELYVSEADRRGGAGRLLMERLTGIAAETGCSRLEWTADRDNPLAIAFYRSQGYMENQGKTLFRVQIGS
jgi:ribosomal protein S18 acetylase RimI-like enzyme